MPKLDYLFFDTPSTIWHSNEEILITLEVKEMMPRGSTGGCIKNVFDDISRTKKKCEKAVKEFSTSSSF